MSSKSPVSRRMLMRGESSIASTGLALAAIVLCAMGASAWVSARAQETTLAEARQREIESVGVLLSSLSGRLLALDDVSAVRLLVADAARRHGFDECRLTLPGGQVVAAETASEITIASLPKTWPASGDAPATVTASTSRLCRDYPVTVSDRGSARLEIQATVATPAWALWEAQAGIGLIGAAALCAILLVYRRMRFRMRALSYIRESLLALDAGECSTAALSVQPNLGPEADAWNELLSERERLQQVLVTKRLLELPAASGERGRDLTSMCDAMAQGLILVDSDLRMTYANGAAGLFLRTTREQLLGASIGDFLDAEIMGAVKDVASGALRRSTQIEVARTEEDGSGVLRFGVRPVRRDDDSTAMIVIEDVTQQRHADDTRNEFLATITHELRTPLTNILLSVETAMDLGETDVHLKAECLNAINEQAKRLDRMVGDMLTAAELEAGTHTVVFDDVSLASLMKELENHYQSAAREKGITLKFDLPPKMPTIQADRDKISAAVNNLLGNATKYTPDGGNITVQLDADEQRVVISVRDTGMGMREEDLQRIFDKFYRADDERLAGITGSGLGLAMARDMIRLHGGDITAESEYDKGSTFTITVPILARAA